VRFQAVVVYERRRNLPSLGQENSKGIIPIDPRPLEHANSTLNAKSSPETLFPKMM